MTRIITALDFNQPDKALAFAERVDPSLTRLKIGKQLFTLAGPALVESLQQSGFDVFLDLKFHDIPNTVASAVAAAASLGVWMLNVHASGGPRMLDAARQAVPINAVGEGMQLIGVTVLTSMDDAELQAVGVNTTTEEQVRLLATLSMNCGLDGVVCSPLEVPLIRAIGKRNFLTITPGIRPAMEGDAVQDDQRRVMTPADAVAAGSDFLVIGRPITRAEDPQRMLEIIAKESGVPA